jgi:uncharacterized protein (UPF0332 family)
MNKIKWCCEKKEGLNIIEPNPNLSKAYLKKAEEALQSMRINTVKDWKISTAYYTIYFSLYSVLMKTGIKCEIHSCTIEFAKKFLGDYFNETEIEFVKDSLKARIDSQYYIDRTVPDKQYDTLITKAPEFLIKCKEVLIKLNEKKVNEIREKIKIL